MQGRLKQLRLSFGMDQETMASLLRCPSAQLNRWESRAETLAGPQLQAVAGRLGVSADWLSGADGPMWSDRVESLRQWLAREIGALTGIRLIQLVSATTAERLTYVLELLRAAAPDLFGVEFLAGWLGLSTGSTELLLAGALNPGPPVIARASDLTGLPERWFRVGPREQLAAQNDEEDDQ